MTVQETQWLPVHNYSLFFFSGNMENKYVRSRKILIRQKLSWAVKTVQKRKAVLPAMNQALIFRFIIPVVFYANDGG
jgi:hypothetical protein